MIKDANENQTDGVDNVPGNEDLLRAIINSLPAAIYTTDAEGRLTHFNPAAVEFSGRKPELGSDRWCVTWKLFYPDGKPMAHDECPMAVAVKEGRSIKGEEAIAERPDGKRIWFEAYPSPLFNEKGEVIGGINMLIDISERKEYERQKNLGERNLSDFFDNATLGFHWVDPDGTILKVNKAELDMLGYSREEYVGHNIREFHVDKEVIDDVLGRLKKGEEMQNYEARLRCRDGSVRHVRINTNVYWENGEFIHTRCLTRDITDRKIAEQKYRMLFDSMDEGFCIVEVLFNEKDEVDDYLFVEVNPAFEKETRVNNIKGKRISEIRNVQGEPWFEKVGKVVRTGESRRFEIYSNREGFRCYDVYALPYGRPEDNQVAVFFRDVTRSKENERNNSLLGAIINDSNDAIISKNLDGIITSWNAAAERLFGYSEEEALGQPVTMLIPPEREGEEDEILGRLEQGERLEQFETVRLHKNGTRLQVSITVSPIKNARGEVIGASKIARDITERKKSREKQKQLLREVEAERKRLIEIFQHAPSFMVILRGPDHIVERSNRLYSKLVGYRELEGRPLGEAVPEAEDQGFIDLMDRVYETGEPYMGNDVPIELQTPSGDKEKHFLNFVYQPIREADGSISGVFVQGVDLTERKKVEEKLKAINETLEERVEERTSALLSYQKQLRYLATKLSRTEEEERRRLASELHDNLGQMLAVCKMKLELMQKTESTEGLSDTAQLVDEAIDYTRELMSDLKPPPSLGEEDINKNMDWLARKMKKYDLEVRYRSDDKPKPLSENVQTTILQCVRELLFNVVKHTDVNEARVDLSRSDHHIRVVVEDEGSGFEEKVNEPDLVSGRGFGLFNIKERIDMLGGRVDIKSEPGAGTRVMLLVPLEVENAGTVSNKHVSEGWEEEQQRRSGEKRPQIKVLLVDDHEMMREGLKKIIEQEKDLTVIAEAPDGKSAVQLAHETNPDVIIMDINLPGMNGIDATQQIKKELPEIVVIGLSFHNDSKVEREMKEAGASAYVSKSDAFETLCTTIRREGLK